MNYKNILFRLFIILVSTSIFAQNKNVISGTISNKETGEPLPFASISLRDHPIGTISNENGAFDFYIPQSKRNGIIVISFIGFNSYEFPISSVKDKLNINLQPSNNLLDEVVLSEITPLDYIKRALDNLVLNYPQEPYQSIAYYREKFIENGAIINKDEGVFKTYYTNPSDTAKNQHQLLLYKPVENPQQFQFMREWIQEKEAKRRKKANEKGETYDEDEYDGTIDMDLGGPESVIDLDINHDKDNYLNQKYFKKYEYTFGDETILNGERLVTINFKAKRKIEYMKDSGKILINKETYAIVLIEQTGKFSIPFIIRPILFTIGLKIGNPYFSKTISYQKFKDKWYPKLFRWDANIKLTKRHSFEANEHSDINIGQVFSINKLDSIATPILKEKIFDTGEDIENQVYNDLNLNWNEINIVRD
ncbi:MAG: carboxypeptidase-like regulatory domain-containing protein [Bacteroidota bacterium]